MTTQDDGFTLYRFYAADDTLLYVGLTVNPGRRFERHRADKPWWPQVARIAMEPHATLELLRAAERAAIETERPVHNIRMNGGHARTTTSPIEAAPTLDGLVGRFFHTWRDKTDDDDEHVTVKRGKVLEWQGHVVDQISDDLYLIELYSWWDGYATGQRLAQVSTMGNWTFYANNVEMIAALGCRVVREIGQPGRCGNEAEYLTDNESGGNGVCDRCAGYYSKVRPIIWSNGTATLGAETTLPHPLSAEGLMRR